MADPVRLTGLFSTFDTEAVISQLTAARQGVIVKMDRSAAAANAKKSSLATIQSRFLSLLTRASTLASATSLSTKSVAVTGTGLSASASPTAATGTFSVDVLKLATNTKTAGAAISAAIDATKPLAESNFSIKPTNGTFTARTTTGGSKTFTVGAAAAAASSTLATSNLTTAVTAGTFTIATENGGSAQVTVDPATQSLDDMVTAINAAGVGITATITNDENGRANKLTLTSSQGDITLGDSGDTSNFLTATNLYSATGTSTKTSTMAFTKQMTLNDVVADINGSAIGVTASITNDANGRANKLTLTSSQGDITLGNAGDTSNFLSATNVLASPGTTTRESTLGIARMSISEKMSAASWHGGAPNSGDQSFTINGKEVSYNTANDSLSDIVARINASNANVTARYDVISDTVRLENTKPGSLGITMADNGGGNLLSKLGLTTSTQTLGANAEYKIDGGAIQYSSTNNVTLGSGVNLTLTAVTEVDKPVSVSVTQDQNGALNAVRQFVTGINDVFAAIDSATKADKNNPGSLSGDASLRQLRSTLRNLLSSTGVNINGSFKRLDEIGISFGAIGSSVGTTNSLSLDETKFKAVLASDPSSVQALVSSFTLGATIQPGGTGTMTGLTGNVTGNVAGSYRLTDNGAGLLTSVFTPKNGGPQVTSSAPFTPGGTVTALIPGVTIQMGPTYSAGTSVVSVAATSKSPIQAIKELVETQSGAGGVLQKRQDTYTAVTEQLAERKIKVQASIDKEMAQWRKKFIAMEQAQAQYQGVASALAGMINQMQANSGNG